MEASANDIEQAIKAAVADTSGWSTRSADERAAILSRVADLFEQHAAELFVLTTREAGKTLIDAVAEIREAVDFARYYAAEARRLGDSTLARGVITCISPWNFPLAIFSGPVLAALAVGNRVLAKPAETTTLIAARAVELMHQAGVPADALQLLPGRGSEVGAALTGDARIDGVCFTGSTQTAQRINRMMAEFAAPDAPLIAETGGLNAMIVDSTALPEQVVRDVLISSFQSAGQRCSALRMLYVQEDIAEHLLEMLFGAMEELRIGNPWLLSTDVGPVIDASAKARIEAHCDKFRAQGRLLKQLAIPEQGHFVAPSVIRLDGIEQLEEEIFGPVLHIATFKAFELDQVIDAINARGYGLTFGLHSRIESRVADITARLNAGNLYVNRNQIGAIVGSQPFGGEGLSGTGPKAGGPAYAARLTRSTFSAQTTPEGMLFESSQLQQAINTLVGGARRMSANRQELISELLDEQNLPAALDAERLTMPGPTGESNQLSHHPRGVMLCLGPTVEVAKRQAAVALSQGNPVLLIVPGVTELTERAAAAGVPLIALDGQLSARQLAELNGFAGVCSQADPQTLRGYRKVLAAREGALLPLIATLEADRFVLERHLCIDTTAAGGNASLIAQSQ